MEGNLIAVESYHLLPYGDLGRILPCFWCHCWWAVQTHVAWYTGLGVWEPHSKPTHSHRPSLTVIFDCCPRVTVFITCFNFLLDTIDAPFHRNCRPVFDPRLPAVCKVSQLLEEIPAYRERMPIHTASEQMALRDVFSYGDDAMAFGAKAYHLFNENISF